MQKDRNKDKVIEILDATCSSLSEIMNKLTLKDKDFAVFIWGERDELVRFGTNAEAESLVKMLEEMIVCIKEENAHHQNNSTHH